MSVLDTDVQVTHAGDGSPIAGRILHNANLDSVNIKDFGAVGDGQYKSLDSKYGGSLVAAQLAFPNVHIDSLADSVDWAAIQAALSTGKKVIVPQGDYYITQELEMVTPGQVLSFENTGGYAYGSDALTEWSKTTGVINTNTRFKACGNRFRSVVRTRRKHRASRSSLPDNPLSTVINVQAEGVVLDKVCIWLDGKYGVNDTTANLGDSPVDVGIFVGTRCGFQAHDVQVLGYFRYAGIYLDVTGAENLPRFNARSGAVYAEGSTKDSGTGAHLHNPYILGARQGLAILGPTRSATGSPYYYDDSFGTGSQALTKPDQRGLGGFSDFMVLGGQIYGPDHHSKQRLKDPELDAGVLSEVSLNNEKDGAPCAVYIDLTADNANLDDDDLWGLRFIGTRIASFEAFRMRLGRVDRVSLIDCHMEARDGGVLSTTGTSVQSNDYGLHSYADIAGQSVTGRVKVYGSVRSNLDDIGKHFYGQTLHAVADNGNTYAGGFITTSDKNQNLDLRAWTGTQVSMRVGNLSQAWVSTNGLRSLNGFQIGDVSSPIIKSGLDSPEGVVVGAKGSLYLCTGTSGGGLYVKQSDAALNTGWVLK